METDTDEEEGRRGGARKEATGEGRRSTSSIADRSSGSTTLARDWGGTHESRRELRALASRGGGFVFPRREDETRVEGKRELEARKARSESSGKG